MAVIVAVGAAEGGDGVTQFLHEVGLLAHQVGPGWAFILVLTVCLFLPDIGVVPQFAKLIAADRADKRKRTVEYQRLLAKLQSRSTTPIVSPPPAARKALSSRPRKK